MLSDAFGHPMPSFALAFVAEIDETICFCKRVDRAAILLRNDPAARQSQSFQRGTDRDTKLIIQTVAPMSSGSYLQ